MRSGRFLSTSWKSKIGPTFLHWVLRIFTKCRFLILKSIIEKVMDYLKFQSCTLYSTLMHWRKKKNFKRRLKLLKLTSQDVSKGIYSSGNTFTSWQFRRRKSHLIHSKGNFFVKSFGSGLISLNPNLGLHLQK